MLGLAVVAMLAFGAILAAAASAETTLTALWLAGGNAIAAELAITLSGGVIAEDTKAPIVGVAAVLCSITFSGSIKVGGAGEIERLFNLSVESISSTPLTGLALACEAVEGCEAATMASPIEVWPKNLPWATLLFLTESGEFLYLIEKMGFESLCLILGINVEDSCESADSMFAVDNESGAQIPAGVVALPLSNCTLGGAATGSIQTDELIPFKLTESGELTVSSE
jgi:hypothetical protein